jgi:hypothetical protein
MTEPAEIVLEEARRRWANQNDRYDDVRGRSFNLLSASAVVAGFLGFSVDRNSSGPDKALLVIALAGFICIVILALYVNIPIPSDNATKRANQWEMGDKLDDWFAWLAKPGADTATFALALAERLESARKHNELTVTRRSWALVGLGVCLAVEVIAWGVAAAF